MKNTRRFVLIFTLIAACLCLCGCAPVYEVHVRATGYDDPKYTTDILIRIDEYDPNYTDVDVNAVRSAFIRTHPDVEFDNDELCEAFKSTELCRYSVDGYRSLNIHNTQYTSYDKDRFEFLTENRFESFCKKYQTCKIAVTDDLGSVIQVSDEVPMVLRKKYTLDPKIVFNTETGEVRVSYANHSDDLAFRTMAEILLMPLSLLAMLIIGIVWIAMLVNHSQPRNFFLASGIIMALFALPLVYICAMNLADIFLSKPDISKGWYSITSEEMAMLVLDSIPVIFTIILLTKAIYDRNKNA